MKRPIAVLVTLGLLTFAGSAPRNQPSGDAATDLAPTATTLAAQRWRPSPGMTFQIQYAGTLRAGSAQVIDLDGDDTRKATVRSLKSSGKRVICYLNAGAWENWRSDRKKFPASVIGATMKGWPDERWLDIRKRSILMPIMIARLKVCKAKGFDAVDPDNMDGYQARTGFAITRKAELAYLRALSKAAHRLGLSIGLKNGLKLIKDAQPMVDFAVNEQCLQYHECSAYRPFVQAGKAVFHIEYRGLITTICTRAPSGFSTVLKHRSLNAWVRRC